METTISRYSPQQEAVFAWVKQGTGSALVESVAGSGKTTTIIRACQEMRGSVAIVAYNKKIADEIGEKLVKGGVGKNVTARTFHSFGFNAWRRVAPKVRIDEKKVANIMGTQQVPEAFTAFVAKLVSLAKNHAVGVLSNIEDARVWFHLVDHYELDQELPDGAPDMDDVVNTGIAYAKAVLRASSQMDNEVIDFDDMLYAPLAHNARMWQNDWILVDEAQDTNPARRALAKKMLRPGGRAIFVGDSRQAIYGFTGADSDSMDIIAREFNCTLLPLTVTYRCPKSVVEHAHNWVQHITAHDSAPEGYVNSMTDVQFLGTFNQLADPRFNKTSAILCRNTKPLVALAYQLIRRNVPCHVEGREIGRGLVALAKKWKVRTVDTLVEKLDEYLKRETEKFMAKGQEQKAEALADKVETLKVIIDAQPEGTTLPQLEAAITKLFGDTPDGVAPQNLTLSTVHKAKGREWETVYLWGRNKYMPSPFARQDWQVVQETNLIYVAVTRAKFMLTEVEVTQA
jgi:DNA helicase-2/ATP-dependent DNA helicase PcrA